MEKTFEELITENHTDKILPGRRIITDYNTLHFLMQLVREATIAECVETAREYWTSPEFHIKQLPTDRIKIEKSIT